MAPTTLALYCTKATRGEGFSSIQAAQVNHGGQFLLLFQADFRSAARSQDSDYVLVQVRGRHLGGMAR